MRLRVNDIKNVLNVLYPDPPVPLNHTDKFTFLVAVVLSAQTTDGKVNDCTKVLFSRAPTPQLLSAMPVEEVQRIISPVGLAPKKAQYLVSLSKKILDDFNGEIPSNYRDLESLPGVGHKTASVIMSQAFGEPAIAVDTHVHRLALRWGLSKHEKNVDKVQQDLCALFDRSDWNNIHLQMIYFGREYCTAVSHTASQCPICSWVHTSKPVPSSFDHFPTQKRAKGIVYYSDRIAELHKDPSLTACSPVKTFSEYTCVAAATNTYLGSTADGEVSNKGRGKKRKNGVRGKVVLKAESVTKVKEEDDTMKVIKVEKVVGERRSKRIRTKKNV
mmetsp:Transcript_22396/g.32643  ORF Transcript_22396/g.32643 Transcript_22396/m.32643 type:complete len:330 (-) Transcript_22396:296-1285(-)